MSQVVRAMRKGEFLPQPIGMAEAFMLAVTARSWWPVRENIEMGRQALAAQETHKPKVSAMLEEGKSIKQIAIAIGKSESYVYSVIRNFGLKSK